MYNSNKVNNKVRITTSSPSGTYTIFLNGTKYKVGVSLIQYYEVPVSDSNYNKNVTKVKIRITHSEYH